MYDIMSHNLQNGIKMFDSSVKHLCLLMLGIFNVFKEIDDATLGQNTVDLSKI